MNFNELLESYMLLELSPQELYDKLYADKINQDDFMKIASLDPTGDDNTTGAYTNWLVDQYLKDRLDFEKPIRDLLDKFDKNKNSLTKKNINKFRDLDELEKVLAGVQTGLVKGSKFKTPEGVKVVYEDDQFQVEVPQSYKASCSAYGNKTSWCTASKSRRSTYFDRYTKSGNLYVIRDKTNPGTPIGQLHIANNGNIEFQNKDNRAIDDYVFFEKYPKLLEFFKSVGYKEYDAIRVVGRILKYDIREDGVYVFNNIDISDAGLNEIPEELASLNYIVIGNFDCTFNKLTSLKGCPKEVGDNFNCSYNKITSLEGGPKQVKSFDCRDNQLTSLKGIPIIDTNFSCNNNQLTSLEYSPIILKYGFYCDNNQLTSLKYSPTKTKFFSCNNNQLTSLEGCPKQVKSFDCRNNQLTSLKGVPNNITLAFHCDDNQLTSLKGAPQKTISFSCSNNQLTSLEGAPKEVTKFICSNNPGNFTEEDVRKVSKVKDEIVTEAFKILTKFKTILEKYKELK